MQVIPVVIKTPALCSMPGVFGVLFTWKKKDWQDGEVLSHWNPGGVLSSGCVGVQCHQAARVGCAAELGAGHHPPAGDSLAAAPARPGPSRGSHGSFPHTQQLSLWSHYALALRQGRNVHGLVTSLVITTLTKVSMLSMCSRTHSEWFDKVWFSSFSGSCLLCSSCCSTALTKSCSEFSLGMQHHSLSVPGCWSTPSYLKWSVIW